MRYEISANKTGIPGRRKQYWGTSTWYALLQPSVLLQFCGYGVWNVRTKTGRERPPEDWIIVPNARAAILTEEEAAKIAQARKAVATARQQFGSGVPSRSCSSPYLLSSGLFRCDRCGANMIGFHTDSGTCYVCGSQPYRRGMGCGPGVYVPKHRVESEVLDGLREVLGICTDQKSFTRRVNDELRAKWEASTGVRADSGQRIAAIDKKGREHSAAG